MSNNSNGTSRYYHDPNELRTAVTLLIVSDCTFAVLILIINAWLLGSILTSPEMRARLRNQLICSVAILHILDCLMLTSIDIAFWFSYFFRFRIPLNCAFHNYLQVIKVTSSSVSDLQVVLLACTFLAQVLDFDPTAKLGLRRLRIATIAFLLFPWLFSLLVCPLSLIWINSTGYPCIHIGWKQYYIVECVFTITPLCVAAVVIAVAVLFRYTRFGGGSITAQGNMGVHLMGSGREIDSSLAYIGAWLVCVACETFLLVVYFEIKSMILKGLVTLYVQLKREP